MPPSARLLEIWIAYQPGPLTATVLHLRSVLRALDHDAALAGGDRADISATVATLLGIPLLAPGAAALAGLSLPRMPPERFVTIRGGSLQELAVEYPVFGADREFQF